MKRAEGDRHWVPLSNDWNKKWRRIDLIFQRRLRRTLMDEIRFVVFEARYFFLDVAARKRPFLLPEVEKKTKVKKKNKQNTNFGPIFECRLASRTLIDGRRFFSHFCWTRNFSIFSLLRLHFSSLSLRCTAIDCWCCFRCCRQTAAVKTVMANQNKSTHWQTTTEGQEKIVSAFDSASLRPRPTLSRVGRYLGAR